MYFKFFKLHSWDKRSADNRRRLNQRLLRREAYDHSRGDHRAEFRRRLDAGGDGAGAGAAPGGNLLKNRSYGPGIRGKIPSGRGVTNLEAFAASDAFDAAYIASPNICHFEQAMCLLRHGKHVLLEKPGVLTRKQTETLVETAKANHVVYLEAMRLVFDDALPIIRDALPEIGTLRRVTAEFTQYSSRYDRVRAGEPNINAFDPALCNAAILDMGCYPIHALISLFGEPAHVSAEAYHLESGFEAGGIALLRYEGFVCEAIWSKVCRQAAPTTFMGEDGSILLDDINHIRRIWLVRRSGETVELPYREKLPNNMMYELREFAGYIASGAQPEKRSRDSILTAAVIEEARRQTGTTFGGI